MMGSPHFSKEVVLISYDSRELSMDGLVIPAERTARSRPGASLSWRRLFFADAFLLLVAFFLANTIKRGKLILPDGYLVLLALFFGCWLVASLVGKKFQPGQFLTFRDGIRTLVKSNLYLTYCISFVIVFLSLTPYSRLQVYLVCILLAGLNVGIWAVASRYCHPRRADDVKSGSGDSASQASVSTLSYRLIGADLGLLILAFFTVNILKRGQLSLLPGYDELLLILLAMWFIPGLITDKYRIHAEGNIYDWLWQWLKAGLLTLASMSVLIYGLRLFHYSRTQSLGTVILLMALEAVLVVLVFSGRNRADRGGDIETARDAARVLDQKPVDLNIDIEAIRRRLLSPARLKLAPALETAAPEVYAFIAEHVDLDDIRCYETSVGQSCAALDPYADYPPTRLLVNLHKLNDIRRVNQYFLDVQRFLLPGGCFIGYAHTIRTHHQWVYGKFPRQLGHLIYAADFVLHRVIPKLPYVKKLYFLATRGRNRVLSRAELLGRLSFCGFDIVAEREIDKRLWVIARKVKSPSFETNPTYGPLVSLNRVGYKGEVIRVYKLRTMHPYSEFLQNYVYNQNGLRDGGKLSDDFRLTTWGRFFRKFWIDELPMLYNWLKGDLKIVGVRPLSAHYLGLYDEELRRMRLKSKPGLLPPFYSDLPQTFDEIRASEKRYLTAYFKSPITTDVRYFFKSLINIFLKRARSH